MITFWRFSGLPSGSRTFLKEPPATRHESCKEHVAVRKDYNLRRHFETKCVGKYQNLWEDEKVRTVCQRYKQEYKMSKYRRSLKKGRPRINYAVHQICQYPQIKAESLHLKHILVVSFQIRCGGVQSQNDENCYNVPGPNCSL